MREMVSRCYNQGSAEANLIRARARDRARARPNPTDHRKNQKERARARNATVNDMAVGHQSFVVSEKLHKFGTRLRFQLRLWALAQQI